MKTNLTTNDYALKKMPTNLWKRTKKYAMTNELSIKTVIILALKNFLAKEKK